MSSFVRILSCLVMLTSGCYRAVPREEPQAAPSPCGEAHAVPLTDQASAGPVFHRLRGPHQANLKFACPSDEPCTLPKDTQLELTLTPVRDVACEFAACRVPYLGSLPFSQAINDPCPAVLWSVFAVTLQTDGQTLDASAAEVNVLSSPKGEAYLRFTIENPLSLAQSAAQTSMLDVQLEVDGTQLRGQLSALSAPLPREPASELRFTSLWTATWESALVL
ncbi:MAG: hypothetical protein RLZZ450_6384 [Pseudomonadota bacterium]|jgi:hypothetical protein